MHGGHKNSTAPQKAVLPTMQVLLQAGTLALILRAAKAQNGQTDGGEEVGQHTEPSALAEGVGQTDVQFHGQHEIHHGHHDDNQAEEKRGFLVGGDAHAELGNQL